MEPMVEESKTLKCMKKVKCVGCVSNIESNIWVFWKHGFECQVVENQSQWMTLQISCNFLPDPVYGTVVYASCNGQAREHLWEGLVQQSTRFDRP